MILVTTGSGSLVSSRIFVFDVGLWTLDFGLSDGSAQTKTGGKRVLQKLTGAVRLFPQSNNFRQGHRVSLGVSLP
jgi:hypothetical protein